jgi:arabinan endo-1,5-alpha-L-arabinosidase
MIKRLLPLLLSATLAFTGVFVPAVAEPARQVDIHDPAMAKDGDTFYLYSTGPGITFYSSKDRIHWAARGQVFAKAPAWAQAVAPTFNGHIWAPDVAYHDGRYYLYYSISGFGKNDSAIGVASNKTLNPDAADYKWDDHGIVVRSVAGRDAWNAIDPNVIVDSRGTSWMTFGSFWSGIKLVRLNGDWMKLAAPEEWHSLAARPRAEVADRAPGSGEIEGPFLLQKHGYYYLFVSTGLCCRGKNSTYRIAVGRSKEVTGPYLDKAGRDMAQGGGTPLLSENKAWAGWGGQGVYTFDGTDYVVFHAYEAVDNDFHRLKIAKITWDAAQWPVVDDHALDQYRSVLQK